MWRVKSARVRARTLAAASGAPLKALMQRMGHTTVAASLRYQHVVDGQQDAIADYLDGVARASFSDRERPAEPDACGTFVARNPGDEEAGAGENAVTRGNDGGARWIRTIDLILIRDAL